MSKPLTNRRLLKWSNEIDELQKADSILPHLLRVKIQEFQRENAIRINTVKEKMKAIIEKHRLCDENGNPYSAGDKPVMKDGATWEQYLKEMNELLDQEVHIILP